MPTTGYLYCHNIRYTLSTIILKGLALRIKAIHIHVYQKPFNLKFTSGHLNRTKADALILKFDFDNGLYAVSETTPRDYVTGETPTSVVQTFQACFADILFNLDVTTYEDVIQVLSDLEKACRKNKVANYSNALAAVDLALFDALGKQQQVAAGKFLGRFMRQSIPYSLSVPFLSLEEIEALYPVVAPFKIGFIKVLLGDDDSYNAEKIKLIRKLLGDEAVLQVEVNGYWTFDHAVTTLKKIASYNISGIEQPFSASEKDTARLIELKKRTGLPIILDESICGLADAGLFLESGAVDIINIKIAKCGGLLQSRRIADLAKAHGKMCHLGAHVGETAILTNAGLHFAMATENIRYFEGCSFVLFHETFQTPTQGEASLSHIRNTAGLGVSDEAYNKLLIDSQWVATLR